VALAAKSGSRGKSQDWYRQGLMGCSAMIRDTEEGEITLTRAWATSSAASSGALQLDSSTPWWRAAGRPARRPRLVPAR
jgi:hypothetical protein